MSDYPLQKHNVAANTIRGLAMDAVQAAASGHPGTPMALADLAVVLWTQFLKFNPDDPTWPNRDRFVLSAGHASMLLYGALHLTGYDLSLEEIKNFRQWGSITPGHPENHLTPGVETTTGPLGQGITNAIGMALAERWLAARFNRPDYPIVDHYTYVVASDGDLMEGVSQEASSLAGHLGLSKLIVFYDDNRITIDGSTELAFTEDVAKRFVAYGWHTQKIEGHDPAAIINATKAAQLETKRPSLIVMRTHIGYGSPNKQDTASAHGEPLGEEEITLTKKNLGWPQEKFYTPDEAYEFMRGDDAAQVEWKSLYGAYKEKYPELATQYEQFLSGQLPDGWNKDLPQFEAGKTLATRASSGQVLNAIAPNVPSLLGGSGDLTGSNKTDIKGKTHLTRDNFSGRYIHFGVREHAMAGIMSGMALHGGIRPYGGTFLVFSDYMRPSVRLASLMQLPVIYVYTHDSIGLGEDGPTHQPVEHLMSLRAMPHMTVIRPGDANEVVMAWQSALENTDGPTALVLTRQGVPTLDRGRYAAAEGAKRGAYVLSDTDDPRVILIGTGSELQLALEAQEILAEKGVAARVVSMPSWELFEAQGAEYRESVLPRHITARVSIEAGTPMGWERYLGLHGKAIGLHRFGASAPYKRIYEELRITAEAMADTALSLLE